MEGVPLLTPMETPAPTPETADKAPLAASRPSPALRILFCLVAVLSVAWLFLTWQLVSASARQREGLAHFSAVQESYRRHFSMKAEKTRLSFDPAQFVPELDVEMMYREMYWASEGYLWETVQQGNINIDEMEKVFTKLMAFWKSVYKRKE